MGGADLDERHVAGQWPTRSGRAALNCIGGALALGEPIGPNGLVTGAQSVPVGAASLGDRLAVVRCCAGLLSISAGELVCRLWFQEAAPCSVSPLMTRATSEVSMPLMRKFWPLVL